MRKVGNTSSQALSSGEFLGEQKAATSFPDRYSPIPPNGQKCAFTGLGHSRMYQLLNGPAKPYVRVASLREPGTARGTTLFHVGDMLGYLNSLAQHRVLEDQEHRAESTQPAGENSSIRQPILAIPEQ
jgi:hypothetical protein